MPERKGRYVIELKSAPAVKGFAAVTGRKEGEGPLGEEFDKVFEDSTAGESSWEKAESLMHREAVIRAVSKSGVPVRDIDILFAGDLLDQCMGSSAALKDMDVPTVGIYGACSTMALGLALAAVSVDSGTAGAAGASTSSHFCSAEKQFRTPLEYGGQRTPTAQWTATAAGAAIIAGGEGSPRIEKVIFGRIKDYGINDANNMGAVMAPAAARTIADYLKDTGTAPEELDMILTGDLGAVGSKLLKELLIRQENIDISAVHNDCGLMLYDLEKQGVNAGGSGCGCSAAVVCSHIMRRLREGELEKVLFVGTGALLSAVSALQKGSIPAIAHGVLLTGGRGE